MPLTQIRVPQEERARLMRQRLLEATVECLAERGFAGRSTTMVSQRAGVRRMAHLPQLPSTHNTARAAVTPLG